MRDFLCILTGFVVGVGVCWLAWGRPLRGAIRVHGKFKTDLVEAHSHIARLRHEVREVFNAGVANERDRAFKARSKASSDGWQKRKGAA